MSDVAQCIDCCEALRRRAAVEKLHDATSSTAESGQHRSMATFASSQSRMHLSKSRFRSAVKSTRMVQTQEVYTDDIYHGLPVISKSHANLSAIVVGASGMSGQSQIDVLLQEPKRWKRVFALSRRAPQIGQESSALQHVPVDLLDDPESTAKKLKEANVTA